MARKSLWLAVLLVALGFGPLVPLVRGQMCKYGMMIQMQHTNHQAYQQQVHQQRILHEQAQRQAHLMQQAQKALQHEQMQAAHPRLTPRPPVEKHTHAQHVHIKLPSFTFSKTKVIHEHSTHKVAHHMPVPGVGLARATNREIKKEWEVMQRHEKHLKSHMTFKPPPFWLTLPGSRSTHRPPPHVDHKAESELRHRELVLTKVERKEEMKRAQQEKKEAVVTAKRTSSDTTIVKVDVKCANCHKKMNIHLDQGLPGLTPLTAKNNQPMRNPLGGGCPPGGMPFFQPLAPIRPNMQMGLVGRPGPLDMPMTGRDISMRNPWTDGPQNLMTGIPGAVRKPGPAAEPGVPLRSPIAGESVAQDRKYPSAKEPATDYYSPTMPALTQGQGRASELVLLNPIDAAPARPTRETRATESTTKESAASQSPSQTSVRLDLDGPTLPPLSRSAQVLTTVTVNDGAASSDGTPAIASAPRRVGGAPSIIGISGPALSPLAARVLVSN